MSILKIITEGQPIMRSLRNPNRPPTHPGALLREDILPALALTQTGFAQRLGVSRWTVVQLLQERQAVTPDMALRLERLLGHTAESWLRMQQAVDLWGSRQNAAKLAGIRRLEFAAIGSNV